MAKVRLIYSNLGDAATLATADAYPSMPAESLQSAGRATKARLKQIASAIAPSGSVTVANYARITGGTVSGWIYRTGSMSGSSSIISIGAAGGSGNAKALSICSNVTDVYGRFNNGTSNADTSSYTLTINTWFHVAVTWEAGGLVRLYVNGTEQYTVDPSTDVSIDTVNADATELSVSVSVNNARVARVRLDGRALDSTEVAALAGHRYVHDGALLERWNFDSSLTGERGYTLSGAATYTTGPGAHATANMTQVKGSWASSQVLSAMALIRHNLGTGAAVQLKLYSDAAYGTSVYDSGTAAPFTGTRTGDYLSYAQYFTPTTARSFALEVQNNGTAWDAARLVFGRYFEPVCNAQYSLSLGWNDTGSRSRTEGGAMISEPGEIYRSMSVSFPRIDDADRNVWAEMLYTAGATKELFVSVFPAESQSQREMDYSLTGMLSAPPLVTPTYKNHQVAFSIEEA